MSQKITKGVILFCGLLIAALVVVAGFLWFRPMSIVARHDGGLASLEGGGVTRPDALASILLQSAGEMDQPDTRARVQKILENILAASRNSDCVLIALRFARDHKVPLSMESLKVRAIQDHDQIRQHAVVLMILHHYSARKTDVIEIIREVHAKYGEDSFRYNLGGDPSLWDMSVYGADQPLIRMSIFGSDKR